MWILWLIAAAALGVGEMHQGGFYLLPFAIGATLAAALSLLGVGALLTAIVFVVVSAIVVLALRPVAHRHRRLPPPIRTGSSGARRAHGDGARADRQRRRRRLRADRRRRGLDGAQRSTTTK